MSAIISQVVVSPIVKPDTTTARVSQVASYGFSKPDTTAARVSQVASYGFSKPATTMAHLSQHTYQAIAKPSTTNARVSQYVALPILQFLVGAYVYLVEYYSGIDATGAYVLGSFPNNEGTAGAFTEGVTYE